MSAIETAFTNLATKAEKALVLFVTAGDPSLEQLPSILRCLEDSGADVIELGIPFSDPIADGPSIQASSQRALDRGVNPVMVLEAVQSSGVKIPLIGMGYFNTAVKWGEARFAADMKQAGFSGTIMCDLTPDYAESWIGASRAVDLDTIFLAAPTSTDERLHLAAEASRGFVYAVSRTGVTGSNSSDSGVSPAGMVEKIKSYTTTPVCVGFGIQQPDDVKSVCEYADGAIIGSWLVNRLASDWNDGLGANEIAAQVRNLKAATR